MVKLSNVLLLYSLIVLMSIIPIGTCEKTYYAVIKSCAGWRLNKLPELKKFLRDEIDSYPVEVVFPGGDPQLVIMDNEGNEVEEISLVNMKGDELAALLEKKGFNKYA